MALPVSAPVLPAAVRNRGPSLSVAMPAGGNVLIEILFEIVVTGNLVLLAAFFMQTYPAAPALHEIITHLHLEHGVDAREAVNHHADKRGRADRSASSCRWRQAGC